MTRDRSNVASEHPYDIARHWDNDPDWPHYRSNTIGFGEPFCARCGWLAPVDDSGRFPVEQVWKHANRFLDRAHLIDRATGGIGCLPNLVMLCHRCHDRMPMFATMDELPDAIEWVRSGEPVDFVWQLLTDEIRQVGLTAERLYAEIYRRAATEGGST